MTKKKYRASTLKIVKEATKWAEKRKKEGWTKEDFIRHFLKKG